MKANAGEFEIKKANEVKIIIVRRALTTDSHKFFKIFGKASNAGFAK